VGSIPFNWPWILCLSDVCSKLYCSVNMESYMIWLLLLVRPFCTLKWNQKLYNVVQNVLENEPHPANGVSILEPEVQTPDRSYRTAHWRNLVAVLNSFRCLPCRCSVGAVHYVVGSAKRLQSDLCASVRSLAWDETLLIFSFSVLM